MYQNRPFPLPIEFSELFHHTGLVALDKLFIEQLTAHHTTLAQQLNQYRNNNNSNSNNFSPTELSTFLIQLSQVVENFLINLFAIKPEYEALQQAILAENPIGRFKKQFILTKVKKRLQKPESLPSFAKLHHQLLAQLNHHQIKSIPADLELDIACYYEQLQHASPIDTSALSDLTDWCAQAFLSPEGQAIIKDWYSFQLPTKTDYGQLVHTVANDQLKQRDGFALTDTRLSSRAVQTEVHYCVYCHEHDGDLCSKGFPEKKAAKTVTHAAQDSAKQFKHNPLDVILTGCPLEEKISEMQWLKREGFSLAALAVVMVDNPMCPATGHRICNDCMKSCIYQKQTPVNIPEIETRVLTDILNLPWGVEIYDLLTRWNPLRQTQWLQQPYNHYKVMIAGMGPAGFTLAHHLLQEGCAVLGFDGLKIEPLAANYIQQPILNYTELTESLDERLITGFGGVAEYGITVRWDKNFLKLIYLTLMRRPYFTVLGNARFGGTIKVEDAWELGFDHFAIAVGAGLPKALPVTHSMAPGMRQANDFLMALQLTGAAKQNSLASLQIRLPAVIIGGGLTGVDAATEVQAYYIRQVEKIAVTYQALCNKLNLNLAALISYLKLNHEDQAILHEFLTHATEIQQERQRAAATNSQPNFIQLIHHWGGVHIVYRKTMQQSPAYINNHEELQKALQEGVFYHENLAPTEVILDQYGHSIAMSFQQLTSNPASSNQTIILDAKCILVATGAALNVAYSFEHPETFERSKMQYHRYEEQNGKLVMPGASDHCKEPNFGPFTSYDQAGHRVSFLGDTHPVFHGNVVKAIASAKASYPKIMTHLRQHKPQQSDLSYDVFKQQLIQQFEHRVIDSKQLKPNLLELTVHAPQLSKHYRPGQFYRLQGFEINAQLIHNKSTAAEAVPVFASQVDKTHGTITFTIPQQQASSKLLSYLKPRERIALMGPAGVRSKVSEHQETVLIIGDQLGLVQLQSYGLALKQANNRVVFLGYFDQAEQIFARTEIESIADFVIWAITDNTTINNNSDINTEFNTQQAQTIVLNKNCIDSLSAYAEQQFTSPILFNEIDRIQILGDATLLKAIATLFKQQLNTRLTKQPKLFGSVHSQMQCMLKGVCAQCLQWQIDPETGERKKAVFACSWQDQPLELIDFDNLAERQQQNRLTDALHNAYVDVFMRPVN